MIVLSDSENRMILAWFVLTQYQCVMEGVMAHYWSIFACDSRRPHFNPLAKDDPLRISRRSLPLQKLAWLRWKPHDHSFIRLDTIPACDGRTGGQTDRRRDRQTLPSHIQLWHSKLRQRRRAIVNVPSVRQHIRYGTDSTSVVSWKCAKTSLVSIEQQEDCSRNAYQLV